MSIRTYIDLIEAVQTSQIMRPLREGKVEKHPLRSGGVTTTVINPTRAQFEAAIATYDDQTARFNMDDTQLVIGDHYHWTHHALAEHTGITGISGWLSPWSVVVWGTADINDFDREERGEALVAANEDDYKKLRSHPVFSRLYKSFPKVGFTCNDGLMITFMSDGTHVIEDIDVRMEN